MQVNNQANVANKGKYYTQTVVSYQSPFEVVASTANQAREEIIAQIAIDMAQEDAKKSGTAKALKILPAAAIGTLIAISAAKTPGKIAGKLKSAAASAGYFAGGASILGGMNKIYKKADQKKAEKGKVEKHPVAKSLGRFALDIGVLIAGFAGIKKGAKFINGKFPQIGETISKYGKNIGEKLNNSGLEKINQKIQAKSAIFVEKHPKLANTISKNASLATIVGYLLASTGLSSKLQEDAHKNAEEYMTVLSMADKANGSLLNSGLII